MTAPAAPSKCAAEFQTAGGGAPLLLVSASREDAVRLSQHGPRRDFLELAAVLDAVVLYSERRSTKGGFAGKLFGPHVSQAWQAAALARPGQPLFADGEHNGIPLLFFLAIRRKRRQPVVMLAHFASRRWKRILLRIGTWLVSGGSVVVHSVCQAGRLQQAIGPSWTLRLIPYQVDTRFWQSQVPPDAGDERALFVAAGAENRDYNTLVEAARSVDAEIVVAGASHWARSESTVPDIPPNVRFLTEPLNFSELRDSYARARAVVVPLHDVENQSGITTILEGMSMGLPVIVTATRGQREAIRGPLVCDDCDLRQGGGVDRGPHLLTPEADASLPPSGLYVLPGDAKSLAVAMRTLANDTELTRRLGRQGRRDTEAYLDTSHFIERLRAIVCETRDRAGRKSK